MNTRILITIVFVSFGLMAAMIKSKTTSYKELTADKLLLDVKLETYKISADELADLIIKQDPSVQIIDVRRKPEFDKFHLPGAMNIPLDSLLNESMKPFVNQVSKKNILYSNGTSLANEAWIITRQLGYDNNYVLDGGLNNWYQTIIRPVIPANSAPKEDWDLYQSRKAASQFFTGASASQPSAGQPALAPVPRKTKTRVAGGCS
jgi:rhodanese-related sulfurtransferase